MAPSVRWLSCVASPFSAPKAKRAVIVRPATLESSGLRLDAGIANVQVRRWLDEVANARVHVTTKAVRLAEERAVMLPAPALRAALATPQRVALPVESLQHPLAVNDALLEAFA